MGISISSGRIVMTDGSGNTRFDTNEKLFVATDYKTGTVTRPNYTCETTYIGSTLTDTLKVNQDNTVNLHAINASANTVRGAFKMTAAHGHLVNTHWYNASGSYVHDWQGGAIGSPTLVCGQWTPCFCAVYTFFCESGFLKLREQVHLRAEPGYCMTPAVAINTKTLVGPTFEYKLFCGTFI